MTIDYSRLPEWAQWVLLIGAILTALGVIVVTVRKAWPAFVVFVRTLARFVSTMNALADLPQFMITTAATLQAQDAGAIERDKKIEEIHHEVHYNNGSSVKDAIKRVEDGVAGLYTKPEIDAKTKVLSEEIKKTRPRQPVPRRRNYKPKGTTS